MIWSLYLSFSFKIQYFQGTNVEKEKDVSSLKW